MRWNSSCIRRLPSLSLPKYLEWRQQYEGKTDFHELLTKLSPLAEMGVYSPDMLVDLLPQVSYLAFWQKTSTFLSVLQTPLPLLTICTLASIWKCGQELHGKQVEFLLDRWVEHSHHQPVLMPDYSNTRELSFTLADDIYIRYLSFTGAEDLEAEMIKRFNSPLSLFSVYWIQTVGVPTRLTLVLCTMRDQVITRNWQTFHHRL